MKIVMQYHYKRSKLYATHNCIFVLLTPIGATQGGFKEAFGIVNAIADEGWEEKDRKRREKCYSVKSSPR
jgi:hypothetical protein